jgi:hypothetical protein
VLLVAFSITGCGPKQSSPVTGRLIVAGQPAAGAVLLFHPDDPAASVGSAVAASDGTYSVITDTNPGIPPGTYRVTITWPDPSVKPSERALMMGMAEPGPDLLKGRYETKAKTDVVVTIDASTTEIPPIELPAA